MLHNDKRSLSVSTLDQANSCMSSRIVKSYGLPADVLNNLYIVMNSRGSSVLKKLIG